MREIVDSCIALACLLGASAFALAAVLGPVRSLPGVPVLVIAPPWGDGAATIATRAGGAPVGPVSAPFGTLAVFDNQPPMDLLFQMGAWAVRDGAALAAICGVNEI